MLYNRNLEEIIFDRHNIIDTNELVIISGYVGPNPIQKLNQLPFKTTVIYGMYGSEGIKKNLHEALLPLNNDKVSILYSSIPVHSKCYIWKKDRKIVHALIGSANFSTNGLTTPYREVLAETTRDTFEPLQLYLNEILSNSISCESHIQTETSSQRISNVIPINPDVCDMILYDKRTGETQNAAGINWGQSATAHVNRNDAYIAILKDNLRQYPNLFPPKQSMPTQDNGGRPQRHNDSVEVIWDDGTTMECLFEGNQEDNGIIYPKQIASAPSKAQLGEYLRNRIGVPSGARVTRRDLNRYGRDYVSVSLQGEGIYFFDFSVNN